MEIADKLEKGDLKINCELVASGALLHDLGRSKAHGIDHGVVGAQLAESIGLPESVVRIIKRHVGGGITAQEAGSRLVGQKTFTCLSRWRRKLFRYADKLIDQQNASPST